MTRIDVSETSTHCWRTDHNIGRILRNAREAAHAKHTENSIESESWDSSRWLAILVEEVGEVAHALTYDSGETPEDIAKELIDVAAVATAWLDAMRVAGVVNLRQLTTAWLA